MPNQGLLGASSPLITPSAVVPLLTVPAEGMVTVNLADISQSFNHLRVRWLTRTSVAAVSQTGTVWFNSDHTPGNYKFQYLQYYWIGADAAHGSNSTSMLNTCGNNSPAGSFGSGYFDIFFYNNLYANKTSVGLFMHDEGGSVNTLMSWAILYWYSLAPVRQIELVYANSLMRGSMVELYGMY